MSNPPDLSRANVQQGLLACFDEPSYLEIGVAKGVTFHGVKARRKVAVDPKFRFNQAEALAKNPGAVYHQVYSDDYFQNIIEKDELFDLIYIDGLHTFEQAFRDFTNSLAHLKPKGAIVLDDVLPATYASSLKDIHVFNEVKKIPGIKPHGWAGDVYRLVFLIAAYFPSLSYRTVSDNHGQTVVWREPRDISGDRPMDQIARAPYEDILLRREVFRFAKFDEIATEFMAFQSRP